MEVTSMDHTTNTISSYRCECHQSRLVWTESAKLDAAVRCVQHIHRTAECPTCGRRYVVRVAYCAFRPMRKLSERWLVVEPDGAEREIEMHPLAHHHEPA